MNKMQKKKYCNCIANFHFQVVNEGQSVSYLWELKCNLPDSDPLLNCTFMVQYRAAANDGDTNARQWKTYKTTAQISDYKVYLNLFHRNSLIPDI